MEQKRYPLNFVSTREVFEFESIGPRGAIRKRIQFELIDYKQSIFNLAFGDINPETDELNDTAVSNNGDANEVLNTIVAAADLFFEIYPDAVLYIMGSTPARTRLYQMGISKHLDVAQKRFLILGETAYHWELFQRGTAYKSFFVRQKG